MKILTIIGARPQFVKAAALSRVLKDNVEEIIVHTGQHYDKNMSDIFFEELDIPKPNYNLGVGSGSHAVQTAAMMVEIEKVIIKEKPDYVMTYGDTNSTLAGALAASKLLVPAIHIEAGLRSYNMNMPEEQNRILTDKIAKYLFCPTKTAVANLKKEGQTKNVFNVGDVMCDAVMYYGQKLANYDRKYFEDRLVPFLKTELNNSWYMATIHRAENTDSIEKIKEVLDAFELLDAPVIFPVHPRTKGMVKQIISEKKYSNLLLCEPVGYLDMLFWTKNAKKVVTDSGGLQKEAYILGVDCVTVRDQTEWVETLKGNHNILCKPNKLDIVSKVLHTKSRGKRKNYYGDGNSCNQILKLLLEYTR